MKYEDSSYRRFLNGDPDAFDEIWKEHRLRLTFFIDRYLNDFSAAEDLAIDVFTYVLVHPRKYDFSTSLKTYLFMLGRSRALDLLRRRKLIPMVELSETDGMEDLQKIEEQIFSEERKRAVNAALDSLPRPMAEAVPTVIGSMIAMPQTEYVRWLWKPSSPKSEPVIWQAG